MNLHIEPIKHKFSNGLRAIAIPMRERWSCAIGIWFGTGSTSESPETSGTSHFLEHIVFKGTKKRNAIDIVSSIERVGGTIDAYTSKEDTCFFANLLGEHLSLALDVLGDLVTNPLFCTDDIEREKQVIQAEISDMWDSPSQIVQEIFPSLLYPNQSISRPILGSTKTVSKIKADIIKKYFSENYISQNAIVGSAGNLKPDEFFSLIERYIPLPSGNKKEHCPIIDSLEYQNKIIYIPFKCQQEQIIIGFKTFSRTSEQKYILAVLDAILGQGASSRLFQSVREKHGLAYNIFSFSEFCHQIGFWGIFSDCVPKLTEKLIEQIKIELTKLQQSGITETELSDAKESLKGKILLSYEQPWALISKAVENDIYLGRFINYYETISKIFDVSLEDIQTLVNEILDWRKAYICVLGPKKLPNTLADMDVIEHSITDFLDL